MGREGRVRGVSCPGLSVLLLTLSKTLSMYRIQLRRIYCQLYYVCSVRLQVITNTVCRTVSLYLTIGGPQLQT